jgi:hypothetical protein
MNSIGTVVLPKGTVLYLICAPTRVSSRLARPMMFLTLHPSEWCRTSEDIVTTIELQRDVSLLCMINLRGTRIVSTSFLKHPFALNDEELLRYTENLKKEGLDGWFSTMVGLIQDPSIYTIRSSERLQWSWRNITIHNDSIVPKDWGTVYALSTRTIPATLTINTRFEPRIRQYMEDMALEDPGGTTFAVLLENATIRYIDVPYTGT